MKSPRSKYQIKQGRTSAGARTRYAPASPFSHAHPSRAPGLTKPRRGCVFGGYGPWMRALEKEAANGR